MPVLANKCGRLMAVVVILRLWRELARELLRFCICTCWIASVALVLAVVLLRVVRAAARAGALEVLHLRLQRGDGLAIRAQHGNKVNLWLRRVGWGR